MPAVKRNAHVPYSAAQMFELVNDVAAYPEFLGWCAGARIESQSPREMVASVDIGVRGISQSFRTRNTLTRPGDEGEGKVEMKLVSGPFRRLDGAWTFRDSAGGGSDVGLELYYELGFSPLQVVMAALFDEIARSQMDAFIRRAAEVYEND